MRASGHARCREGGHGIAPPITGARPDTETKMKSPNSSGRVSKGMARPTRTAFPSSLLFALGAVCGLLAGAQGASSPLTRPARATAQAEVPCVPLERPAVETEKASRAPASNPGTDPPAPPAVNADDPSEAQAREREARGLLGLIHRQLAIATLRVGRGSPERAANQADPYMRGWLDSVSRLAHASNDALAAEVEAGLCADQADAAWQLLLLRAARDASHLLTARGLDCVVAGHAQEGIVLWTALDAWHGSELPKSEALHALEARTTDPRTRWRLIADPEERLSWLQAHGDDEAPPNEQASAP